MQPPTPHKLSMIQRNFIRLLLLTMTLVLMVTLSPHEAKAATDCGSVTEISVAECEALVALYNSTNGPNWYSQKGWLVTNAPCSWDGIGCTSGTTSQHVGFIDLPDNQLSGGIPAEFGNLTNLQTLYLFGNQLNSLPAEFGNLSSLGYLDLDNNQLSSLPAEFGNLSSLRELSLNSNQLSSLPAAIGNLASLQTLDISGNQLSSLPVEISNLSGLYSLNLAGNQLSDLPAEFGNLTSLTVLYLNDNQLSSLPAAIGNLSTLKELHLHDNQLSSLPAEIGNLTSLYDLNLSANQLSIWPAEIGNLTSLNYLDLSFNQLSSLPAEIGNLTSLYDLNLSANQLSIWPAEIGNLTSLNYLDLSFNQLSSLPAEIGNLSPLAYLFLNGNQLSNLPAEIGSLSSLQVLNLSANQLSNLPAEIGSLSSLQVLNLSANQLSTLPADFGNLTSLTVLYLSENQLSSLPAEISRLYNLGQLDIHSNPLLSGPLPTWLLQLALHTSFWFYDTNLCEPGDEPFQSWLATIPDLQSTNVICSGIGKVTFRQDSQPNSVQDFRYGGDLGTFRLDNVLPNDDDSVSRQKSFGVESDLYTVRQEVPGNWLLTNITCDPATSTSVYLENNQATIRLSGESDITCTFTNQRKSIVRALKYKDENGDVQLNGDEPPLAGWPILLYDAEGFLVSTENNLTNAQGKEAYAGLSPGKYSVCEELREGWINTEPGLINQRFGKPCYTLSVGPGQIAEVSFGNVDHPVASAAQPDASGGVVIFDMPDVGATDENYAVVDTDEAWLNAPLQAPGLFMPLIEAE